MKYFFNIVKYCILLLFMNIKSISNLKEINAVFYKNDISFAGIFGSYAKGSATLSSDIDILIDFYPSKTKSLFQLIRIKFQLEEILGKKVDLVTVGGLDKYVYAEVLKTVIPVYEQR